MTPLLTPRRQIAMPTAASEFRLPDRQERLVGSNGEVNASSVGDYLRTAQRVMAHVSRGELADDGTVLSREELNRQVAARREVLRAAVGNPQAFRQIGQDLANTVWMTSNRKGYCRRFLQPIELTTGRPEIPVRMKNVRAYFTGGPSRIESQIVTGNVIFPQEDQLVARPFIPQNDLNQSRGDLLAEVAIEALEGIMVGEDLYWYNSAKATIGQSNNLTLVPGALSPQSLASVRNNVESWGLKAAFCLMASDLWVDIIGDASFINALEPVTAHELITTGSLARLYGMTLISEAYRHAEHKVMDAGEFIIVSDASTHGGYTDRGGVTSEPTNGVTENRPGQGFYMQESFSMAIANDRSVAVGKRP